MVKLTIECKDLGNDCNFQAESNYVDDLIYKIAEHLYIKHGLTQLNDEIKDRIKWKIKVKNI
jgi:Predicted small metal-binding protein